MLPEDWIEWRKQLTIFAAPSLGALVLIFLIFYRIQVASIQENASSTDLFYTQLAASQLINSLSSISDNLEFLTLEIEPDSLENQKTIINYINNHPVFLHIDILDKNGQVLKSYNRSDAGQQEAISQHNRQVVKPDLLPAPGQVSISNMTLLPVSSNNLEFTRPAIRLTRAITTGDSLTYLSLVSDGQRIINQFRLTASMLGNRLFLLDENSYWLVHPDTSYEFGQEKNTGRHLKRLQPELWQQIASSVRGQTGDDKGLYTYASVSPTRSVADATSQFEWVVLTHRPEQMYDLAYQKAARDLTVAAILISLIILPVCYLLARSRIIRMRTRSELIDSERTNRSIVRNSANTIVILDPAGQIMDCNPAGLRLFEYKDTDLKGWLFDRTLITPGQQDQFNYLLNQTVRLPAGSHSVPTDFKMLNSKGNIIPVTITMAVDQINYRQFITMFITDNRDKERTKELQLLTEVVFRASTEGIIVTNAENNIEAVNPAFTAITGYKAADVIGKNPRLLRSGKHDQLFYKSLWDQLNINGYWKGEVWNRRKNGDIYPEEISMAIMRDDHGHIIHHVAIFHDISVRKSREAKISYQAHYDQLTGLPNRFVFIDNLSREIGRTKRYKNSFALLFIDLNNFKQINDNLGHNTGDLVLQEAAKRLKESIRESDLVARLAGDEFTVIVQSTNNQEDLDRIIAKVRAGLDGLFQCGSHKIEIRSSIGGVLYQHEIHTSDSLLHAADEAMYKDKMSQQSTLR